MSFSQNIMGVDIKMIPRKLKDIDVLLLAGGLGTRLHYMSNKVPKVLASIHGKPFLELLIDNLVKQGFRRIIICVGYLKDQVLEQFLHRDDCQIIFSEEENPLGTGGAVKNARNLISSPVFITLNGDSFCDIDYSEFYNFHITNNSFMTIVLTSFPITEQKEYGSITLSDTNRIIRFKEKTTQGFNSKINSGIYLMTNDIFHSMPDKSKFSLEEDLFPKLLDNNCFGYVCDKELFDIGTPERLNRSIETLTK